jgi:CubicO group peptidase (beta-lactamase class C family)
MVLRIRGDRQRFGRASSAFLLTALASLSVTNELVAQTTGAGAARAATLDLTVTADRVFAAWNHTHGPGCADGVARGGTTLLTRGYGMADIQSDRPITPTTILESGSVAKQFTATAVLLLMQDGKLSLDDDARRYLPELPHGRTITVRHLLTHQRPP